LNFEEKKDNVALEPEFNPIENHQFFILDSEEKNENLVLAPAIAPIQNQQFFMPGKEWFRSYH